MGCNGSSAQNSKSGVKPGLLRRAPRTLSIRRRSGYPSAGCFPAWPASVFTELQHTIFFLHAGQAAALSIDSRTVFGERYP